MADSVGSTSSASYLLPGSSNRMFGLASGLDIDSMVSKMMQAEEIPLDQLKQQQQLLQWKQDDYRSMNSLLLDLYNSTFDMTLQSNYLVRSATSTDQATITATASTGAAKTTYMISSASVATAAYNVSNGSIANSTSKIDPNESLWNMRGRFASDPFSSLNITDTPVTASTTDIIKNSDGTYKLAHGYVDTKQTISIDNATVYTSKAEYDADTSGSNKVYVDAVTGNLTFNYTPDLTTASVSYSYANSTNTSFSVSMTTPDDNGNPQSLSWNFDGKDTLNDVMDTINGDAKAGVTMFFDSTNPSNQVVSIVRNKTGNYNKSGYEMTFSTTGDFLTNSLKLNSSLEQKGTDSQVVMNGLTTSHHENTFTMNGVTFNVLKDFNNPASATPPTPIMVSINDDTSGIFDKIKSWVDKYNDTIKQINDKISQKKNRDYPPLTDTQKKSMSDSDIQLWNDKAMSGMLSDDTILPGGLDQMRMDIYSSVNSVTNTDYNQLADIGITTSTDYSDNGKLVIDEAKLKAAIAADPTSVMNLFTNNGVPSGGTDPVYDNEGIMMRLQTTIQNTMNSIYQVAGQDTYTYDKFSLGKSIHDYGNQISDMMTHLQDVQNRYYAQFTAMEQAIQQANQQGSFISQNFAG